MSDEKSKASAAPKGGGGGPGILGMVLPAVLAAAAAFGGAKVAGAGHAAPAPVAEHEDKVKPPGPTLALDPFVVTIPDSNKKVHPMKVTIAIEFKATSKEEEFKTLTPRLRDASLTYLRTLTFDDAIDPAASDKMRPEILERLRAAGAEAERVLITDLVVQ
jgi:flagellar basal body-associated protein FliL